MYVPDRSELKVIEKIMKMSNTQGLGQSLLILQTIYNSDSKYYTTHV